MHTKHLLNGFVVLNNKPCTYTASSTIFSLISRGTRKPHLSSLLFIDIYHLSIFIFLFFIFYFFDNFIFIINIILFRFVFFSIKNVRWHKYNAFLFHEAIEKGSLSWRGFSSLNLLLCRSTLILRYFFPLFIYFSLVVNILDGKDEKTLTRTLERDRGVVLFLSLFSLLFPRSSLLHYVFT